MRQLVRFLPVFNQRTARQPDAFVKTKSLFDPILVPELPTPIGLRFARMASGSRLRHTPKNGFDRFVRANEKLQFHLFELPRTESKIARINLVAESLSYLRDSERNLLPGSIQHIFELHEDRLRRFWTEVREVVSALDRSDVGLQHQVEWPWLSQQAPVLRVISGRVFNRLGCFSLKLHGIAIPHCAI